MACKQSWQQPTSGATQALPAGAVTTSKRSTTKTTKAKSSNRNWTPTAGPLGIALVPCRWGTIRPFSIRRWRSCSLRMRKRFVLILFYFLFFFFLIFFGRLLHSLFPPSTPSVVPSQSPKTQNSQEEERKGAPKRKQKKKKKVMTNRSHHTPVG